MKLDFDTPLFTTKKELHLVNIKSMHIVDAAKYLKLNTADFDTLESKFKIGPAQSSVAELLLALCVMYPDELFDLCKKLLPTPKGKGINPSNVTKDLAGFWKAFEELDKVEGVDYFPDDKWENKYSDHVWCRVSEEFAERIKKQMRGSWSDAV